MRSLAGTTIVYDSETQNGLILRGWDTASGSPATTASVFAVGAEIINIVSGICYRNNGTTASPTWQNQDEIATSEIADGAVTPVKSAQAEAVTATSDGLTTGLISVTARHVTITAASANDIATLPAAVVGKEITGFVGTNGCELRTPASSNVKINDVDSDGTNEAAIPADTNFRLLCVATDKWILTAVTKLGAVVTAIVPDAA